MNGGSALDSLIAPRWRRYLAGVATAATPLMVGYGVLSEGEAALWVGLIGAVLATGVQAAHAEGMRRREKEARDSKR